MENNFKKQIFWNTLGSSFHSFNSLFFLVLVTRINGVNKAGIFTLCFATACILYTLAVYSGRTYQVSEREESVDDREFIFNRLIMSVLMIVIALLFGIMNNYNGVKLGVLLALCLVKFIEALSDVYHGILQKNNRLDIVGKSLLIRSFLDVMLFFIIDLITKNILLSSLSLVVISLSTFVLYDVPKTRLYKNEMRDLNIKSSFKIIKMGFFTFGFTFISNYLVNAPRYAIDILLGEKFQTIFGIIVMPASIILLINQFALQPMVLKLNDSYKKNDKNSFLKIIRVLAAITIMVGFLSIIAIYFAGIPVLNLLYGIKLNHYLPGLLIIIVGATLYSLSCIFSNALVILRKTKVEFSIYIVSTIFALILSRHLTRINGFDGAVYSYLLIMSCLFILSIIYYEIIVHCVIKWKKKENDKGIEIMPGKWELWNSKKNNFKKYESVKSDLIYGTKLKSIPKVSIMLLTYKRSEKLKFALESAINQDYDSPYEICVIDDSGFDKKTDLLMKEYCEKYANIIYYRHKKNIGQYANWNRACELCRTKWYCLLHDDDMLKPDYLANLMNAVKGNDQIGLIGVYEEANDTRVDVKRKKRLIDRLIDYFIKKRKGKIIELKLEDNIKHIYVMNSTFINKDKAMDIGGLDDSYFPSSDFAFSAKMAYYYSTFFMPLKLVDKGIGESESLKIEVCNDSIECAYNQTYYMCLEKGYSKKKSKRKASIAAVISEIGVKGYNSIDYGDVKKKLGMKKIYNNKIVIFLINLYSKLNWGLLLFRR